MNVRIAPLYTLFAVSALGSGVVGPFLSIFLHTRLGLSLPVVGGVLALAAGTGILATALAGPLIDRRGARFVTAIGLVLQATAFALLALAADLAGAVPAFALLGLGNGLFFPAFAALIVRVVPPEQRPQAFAIRQLILNAGLGAGALVGGAWLSTLEPGRFALAFAANAVSFALLILGVVLAPQAVGQSGPRASTVSVSVRSDRTFLGLLVLQGALVALGYAQLSSTVPIYVRDHVGFTTEMIGLLFAVNTGVVVIAQLPIARWTRVLPRARLVTLVAALWGAAWTLAWYAGGRPGTLSPALLLVAFAVFALGECVFSPSFSPLVAALAPPQALGRYVAASALSYSVGYVIGPAVGGLLLAVTGGEWFWPALVASLLACVAASRRLEPYLRKREAHGGATA